MILPMTEVESTNFSVVWAGFESPAFAVSGFDEIGCIVL